MNDKVFTERLLHAAVITEDPAYFIRALLGKQHADCFEQAREMKIKLSSKAKDQGFVTSMGRYVQRGEAAEIAWNAGQTNVKHKLLFSEDIWCERHGGKLDYDPVKGYHPRE